MVLCSIFSPTPLLTRFSVPVCRKNANQQEMIYSTDKLLLLFFERKYIKKCSPFVITSILFSKSIHCKRCSRYIMSPVVILLINVIRLKLVIEFAENLLTVKTFLMKSFYLCKFSLNKCYLFYPRFVIVCLHFSSFSSEICIFKKKQHFFFNALLCFHAVICHSVLQNRLK